MTEQAETGSLPAHSVHMRLPAMTAFVKLAVMEGWDDEEVDKCVKQIGQLTFWNNGEPLTQQRISDIMEDVQEMRANKRRKLFKVVDGGEGLDSTDQ